MNYNTNNIFETRCIRIFISSTFHDMRAERSQLMTRVFPRLRRYAAERDIALVEVDLQWGIPEEVKRGEVVRLCLDEIDRSRPFFIGLLGDRYGWQPTIEELADDEELPERYSWIEKELMRRTSITEMEIQYGVLRNENNLNAFFYIKRDSDETNPHLHALKQAVRHNGRYPCMEYDTPEELGEMVEKNFRRLLDDLFPQSNLSEFEAYRLGRRAFVHSHLPDYVEELSNFEAIDRFVNESTERYMAFIAPRGIGKSALMANWFARNESNKRLNILPFFLGTSENDTDPLNILRMLIEELCDRYGLPRIERLPLKLTELYDLLQCLLRNCATCKPLLVILDGMDRLPEEKEAKLLNWLPAVPLNVKILFTAIEDDPVTETFRRRNYHIQVLPSLNTIQRRQLIERYLHRHSKRTIPQMERIVSDPKCSIPAVLRTLLDTLIRFGNRERLSDEISLYLAAKDEIKFFECILLRAEEDYGRDNVRDTFSLLAVSKAGLSEIEILAITGMPRLDWSRILCAYYPLFTTTMGIINFSYEQLRQAVIRRYLTTTGHELACRQRIIAFFSNDTSGTPERTWNETAHQYYSSGMLKELHTLIVRHEVFIYFNERNPNLLGCYWRKILNGENNVYKVLDGCIKQDLSNLMPEQKARYYTQLAFFLIYYFNERIISIVLPIYIEAIKLYRDLVKTHPELYTPQLAETLIQLAETLRADPEASYYLPDNTSGGKWIHAYDFGPECAQEAVEIYRRLGKYEPQKYTLPYATALMMKARAKIGSPDKSELEEALSIYKTLENKGIISEELWKNKAVALLNLGMIYDDYEKYDEAITKFREMLRTAQKLEIAYALRYTRLIAIAHIKLTETFFRKGYYVQAKKHCRAALKKCRELTEGDTTDLQLQFAQEWKRMWLDRDNNVKIPRTFAITLLEGICELYEITARYDKTHLSSLALSYSMLAGFYRFETRRGDLAHRYYLQAVELWRSLAAQELNTYEYDSQWMLADELRSMGEFLLNAGDPQAAAKALAEARFFFASHDYCHNDLQETERLLSRACE